MKTTPAQHLAFIRARLVELHGEDPRVDYIRRLDEIILMERAIERSTAPADSPELQDALRVADAVEKMPGGRDMLVASIIRLAAEVRRNLRSVR